jgi:phosphoserine phosphatase
VCEYDLVVEAAMAARNGDVVVITGGPDAYVEGEAALLANKQITLLYATHHPRRHPIIDGLLLGGI